MPIRIAQMMTEMNFGGVEMVVMNYYRHIDRTKFQFDFFALEGSTIPQREEIEALGGRVFIVPRYTDLFHYEKEIQKLFVENDYRIVHSHMNTLGVFSLYGAKKAGIPCRILHNHSTAGKGETKKNIVKYLLRPFAKLFPTELCACSKLSGDWIYGKGSKYRVFNNAIDLDRYRFDLKTRYELRKNLGISDKKVIGHIGRFCYQKNHDLILDIFVKVLSKEKDSILMLIGEGETEQAIKRKAKNLGIGDKVLFMGRQPEAYRYYQAMDVFLLPSRYEGLPVVGIEAQASGLPCVFSSSVTTETKILDSSCFVDGDVNQYAEMVIKGFGIERIDTSELMRKAGYDIKVESVKLVDFYSDLLASE